MQGIGFMKLFLEEYFKGYGEVALETIKHSERVANLTERLLGGSDIGYIAGLLHDIGKSRIDAELLLYSSHPGPMQMERIRDHTYQGKQILYEIERKAGPLDPRIHQGVLYHHERYDGSGYPFGLTGDNIPLIAVIIGLADAYDAMLTRPYNNGKPLSQGKALQKLQAGTKFDNSTMEKFIDMLKVARFLDH
jgi:HD-GYP domain-containing protein (c-di-GMP phosphodiesterase class II)